MIVVSVSMRVHVLVASVFTNSVYPVSIYVLVANVCHYVCVYNGRCQCNMSIRGQCVSLAVCVGVQCQCACTCVCYWPVCVTDSISGQCVTVSVASVCHCGHQWAVCVTDSISGQCVSLCVSVGSVCHCISDQ